MSVFAQSSRKSRQHKVDRRRTISQREHWLAVTLALAVCIPPWLLGGMRWWQQLIFLGLALVPFVLSLIPDATCGSKERFIRLIKFPIFWLGLIFLAYIAIGALNHSWEYTLTDFGKKWRMERVHSTKYIHWLPNGVEAPFVNMNPWRVVILYLTGLLLVCAAWVGLTRKRSVFLILGIIAANAFLLALLGILQKLGSTELIYWTYEPANPRFFSTFHYRNHCGAYLYLGLAASLSAAFYHWRRMRDEALTSSPAPMFLFCALVIMGALLFASSRGGILFGGFVCGVALLTFIFTAFTHGKQGLVTIGVLSIVIAACGYFAWPVMQRALPEIKERLEATEEGLTQMKGSTQFERQRQQMTKVTLEMWRERTWLGWGAGSYRFMFPKFQVKYPELYYFNWNPDKMKSRPNYKLRHQSINYPHNDWVQSLAEYGIVGSAILVMILGYWFVQPLRYLLALSAEVLVLYAGAVAIVVHSFVDFLTWNPPVLFLFVTLLALVGSQLKISAIKC